VHMLAFWWAHCQHQQKSQITNSSLCFCNLWVCVLSYYNAKYDKPYFQNVDDNGMKHMIQSIILEHWQVTVVVLRPPSLGLQQSSCLLSTYNNYKWTPGYVMLCRCPTFQSLMGAPFCRGPFGQTCLNALSNSIILKASTSFS